VADAAPAPTTGPDAPEPVTVTVARRVSPGREVEFETWAQRLTTEASRFAGFLGAGLLRPGHVGEAWHVVYRFDSVDHLTAWESSTVRSGLLAEAETLMRTTQVRRVSGLETWFELPGRTAPAPPRWKMFAVSVIGLYPLQLLTYVALGTLTARWPVAARLALFVPLVAASMTWLVMPRLAATFAAWLYSPRRRRTGQSRRLARGSARESSPDR
jgi:antibiotic biosynthesis monooxygenase (ABM) superfamily enzyme